MRPLSEATSRISNRNFSRKYIALGRVVKQWNEIIGDEFSNIAQPIKINYRKSSIKGEKAKATLDIATSSSYATILPYQKDLILERINKIFGNKWITDIRFTTSDISENPILKKKTVLPLTKDEKSYLSEVLDQVEDPDFREKLESLGKAILTDVTWKENNEGKCNNT